MVEEIVRNYLLTKVNIPVYISVPDEPADKCIVIERTGGGMDNHIRRATVAVQSYGSTMYDAAELHEQVLEYMHDIITLDSVSACAVNSEYNFTDVTTKRFRYQAIFDIVYY